MTNSQITQKVSAVLSAAFAFLAVHVFHKAMPVDLAYAIPALVLIAAHSGVGKLVSKAQPELADIMGEVKALEQIINAPVPAPNEAPPIAPPAL